MSAPVPATDATDYTSLCRRGSPGQGMAARRFLEFFTVNIRNRNTRAAYARAATVFLHWCEGQGIEDLGQVRPVHVDRRPTRRIFGDGHGQLADNIPLSRRGRV